MTPALWSVSVRDVGSGDVLFEQAPTLVLRTASIGKILLLVHIAALAADGELDLAEPLTRTPGDRVADSGIWQYLQQDTLGIGDLCRLVGMASDNLATNVLLRRFSLAAVAATAHRWGLRHTALHDRVRDHREPVHPPELSSGSAAELADLMLRLQQDAVRGEAAGVRVIDWLGNGLDLSQVSAGWGLDPLAHQAADRGLLVRNKTGTDLGVRAEIGVLLGPVRTVAYAVLANWDGCDAGRDDVLARQRRIGLRIAAVARGERPDRPGSDGW